MKKTTRTTTRRAWATALAAAAMLLPALATAAAEMRIINSLADFENFWEAAKDKNFAQQEQLWAGFEARYPGIYENIVFPRSDPDWQRRRTFRLQASFARLPETAPQIIGMMRRADAIIDRQSALFRRAFPDLQPGTPLVFIPLSTFNIAARPTKYGAHSLVVGVDTILENHDVLDSLFAHEFFHVYHFGKMEGKTFGDTMAWPLWVEGLATYVSAQLNPDVAPQSIWMDRALAAACTRANVRAWAGDYLRVVRQAADSPGLQTAWFRQATPEPLPRRGYCVGFHVAGLLAGDHSLAAMAAWDETVYQPKIEAALVALAARGGDEAPAVTPSRR